MWTLALALLFVAPSQVATAAAPHVASADEAGYREALDLARRLTRDQSWKLAQTQWLSLLRDHAGAAYVRGQLEEIRLQYQRASFWAKAAAPKLDDLLSGDLISYEASRSYLRIRYTRESLADFETTVVEGKPLFSHPAHFQGPWSISLEGTLAEVAAPVILLSNGASGLGLRFGKSEVGSPNYFPHTLFRFDRDTHKELQNVEPKALKASNKSVNAEVRVDATLLRGIYQGAEVLKTERTSADFGSLTLSTDGDFGALILTGKVDSGWIDGVLDRAVAEKRHAFDAAWKDPPELSAWTVVVADPSEELSLERLMSALQFLLSVKPEQQELFDLLEKGATDNRAGSLELLKALEQVPNEFLANELREYFQFKAALGLDRWSDALKHFPKLESAPAQQPTRDLVRAVFLINAGKLDEGAAVLDALALADPKVAVVHLMLVRTLLRSGRTPEAREAIRRAREALPSSAGLLELELKVTKADLGPPWKRVFEHAGAHFTVRSDVSVKLCRDAVRVLDKAMERCLFEFGALPNGKPERSLAYLFTGESGYRDYVQGIADHSMENSRGIYAPQLKQIVAWNQPDIEELWSTLRHECVHRYLDLRIGDAPRWFNEGLAETFAAGAQRDQSWKPGTLREMWLGLLREKRPAALAFEEFVYMDELAFLQQCEANYAFAWAWVHYLRFENDIGRKLFHDLLRGFDEGLDHSVAIDRALQGVDTAALQKGFLTQINALLR